jgi:hypothetical protein
MGAGAVSGAIFNQTNLRVTDVVQEIQEEPMKIDDFATKPLVTLEQAVKPLVPILLGIQSIAHTAMGQCTNPADGLTSDESASIRLYSMGAKSASRSFYNVLNTTLRSADSKKYEPWLLFMKLIITALSRLPATGKRVVYRGIKANLSAQYPKGKTIVWSAFSSCTCTMDVLESELFLGKRGARTWFTIECESARDIRKHSYFPSEDELLLLPGTQFQVISSFDHGHGLHVIQLKEIGQSSTFLKYISAISDSVKQPLVLTKTLSSLEQCPIKVMMPVHLSDLKTSVSTDEYRNPKLEKMIDKYQSRSYVGLVRQQLADRDMDIVVEQAMNKKQSTEINLEYSGITSVGASILADGLCKYTSLKLLYLEHNRVSDAEVRFLLQALSTKNTTLKGLNLVSNGITDDGAQFLAEMLKTNSTLIYLVLQDNEIGDRGVSLLTDTLSHHNKSLEQLFLNENKMVTDSSTESIICMLENNQSLNLLTLRACNLSALGKGRLQEAVKLKRDFRILA